MSWKDLPKDDKGHALKKGMQDGMKCPHGNGDSDDTDYEKDLEDDFNVGDEYDFRDGGFVSIEEAKDGKYRIKTSENVWGENKEGEWVTKEELMSRVEGSQKMKDGVNPFHKLEPDYSDEDELDKKYEEAGKIITDAGMKDTDLSYAHKLKNDYADGKITKEELVAKYRERYKDSKDIVGRKAERQGAPIRDKDVPNVSNGERTKEGGLVGLFKRAGHKVSDVTDESLTVDDRFKIVENDFLGFDVFDGDKKIAEDIGNQKDFVKLIEKYANSPKKNPNNSEQKASRSNMSETRLDNIGSKFGVNIKKNSDGTLTISGNDADIDQFMEMYNKLVGDKD